MIYSKCYMLYAIYYVLYAICYMPYASCLPAIWQCCRLCSRLSGSATNYLHKGRPPTTIVVLLSTNSGSTFMELLPGSPLLFGVLFAKRTARRAQKSVQMHGFGVGKMLPGAQIRRRGVESNQFGHCPN